MKLFTVKQISAIDKYTIENEPIESVDLMERASSAIFNKIIELFSKEVKFVVVSGEGNNGGDGLAVARMLYKKGFTVKIFLVEISGKLSVDCKKNFDRLNSIKNIKIKAVKKNIDFQLVGNEIIIDALFGSGLTRPLEGLALEIVKKINSSGCKVISVDMPSGLFGEDNSINKHEGIIHADFTLTLQFPKISFFFAENSKFLGNWFVLPIGLHKDIIEKEPSDFFFLEKDMIKGFLKKREKFSHKGNYGHALLIAGSYGKMGAAVLAARACMRSGVGLLTTQMPGCGYEIIQTSVPESMTNIDTSHDFISEFPSLQNYNAIGIGPGIGKHPMTLELLKKLLKNARVSMILDADALNLVSENKDMFKLLPKNTIITPHPKEFDRLAGKSKSTTERHKKAQDFAKKYGVIIVLKGAYTQVICPDGKCYFNSTGNPGMATGGSGDVLTGIILGIISQGYYPIEAALIGVYLHGLAGDIAEINYGQEAMIASDIINNLGNSFAIIHSD